MVPFLENDPQAAAIVQSDPFAQAPLAAQAVQGARDRARILPELGGLAFEVVDFLDHFDGNQEIVFLETEQTVGIVKEDIGVKNVIFHWDWVCIRAFPCGGAIA